MTTGTIERPTESHPARRLALDPYVMRVRSWCVENARTGQRQPVSLRLGYRTLTLDPPEFTMVLRAVKGGEEETTAEDLLPLEILALLTKSLEDLAKLRSTSDPTSRAVFALQAELMLDSALGTALLAEIKPRVEQLSLFDEKELVRAFSKIGKLLLRTISDISESISQSERERASDLAGSFTDRPLVTAHARAAAPTAPRQVARQEEARTEEPRATEPKPAAAPMATDIRPKELSSTMFLGAGLLLAVAVWLGFFVLPGFRGSRVEALALSDFEGVSVLTEVEARPPSLFVQVDRDRWRALDDAGKLAVVEQVSRVLSREHYSGALFQTREGRPVAQWLRDKGALLIGSIP